MVRTSLCFQLLSIVMYLTTAFSIAEEPQHTNSSATSHSSRHFGDKRKMTGVGNFGEVTPTLFRGAQPTHQGFEALAKHGIDIVVDNRGDRSKTEGEVVRGLGVQYIAIPWHCPFPHDEVFARFLTVVRENRGKKIFVHCRLGDDRTGMMIAAYRIADEGWTADEAMNEMKHFGFSRAHHMICPTLASYEKNFPKHLKSNPVFQEVR
jgi:tyrosine-protein phosphatase SIW14